MDSQDFAAVVIYLASIPLLVVAHELGHLLAALLMGLRVASVGLAGVRVTPAGRLVVGRMALFFLAGPVATIGCAALAWRFAREPWAAEFSGALSVTAIAGLIMTALDLLPVPLKETNPDGLQLWRWLTRPGRMTVAATNDVALVDRVIDRTRDPSVLHLAWHKRMELDPDWTQSFPVVKRLVALARDERTKPADAAGIAACFTVFFGIGHLHRGVVQRDPVDRATVGRLIDLAELAFRLQPAQPQTRIALALARILDRRPAAARELLSGLAPRSEHGSLPPPTAELAAYAAELSAVAELCLGQPARADTLLATVSDPTPTVTEIISALRAMDVLPPLVRETPVAPAPGPP